MTRRRAVTTDRLAIVGAGRAGLGLAGALARAGTPPGAVVAATVASARRASRVLGRGRGTTRLDRAVSEAGVVLICVPDASIESVAGHLVPWAATRCFLHTSGVKGPEALAPLRAAGGRCGALHPLYSFPPAGAPAPDLRGVLFAIDGDRPAIQRAIRIARRLGGRPHRLASRDRAAYHLAASVVANDLVSLLDLGFELASRRLGLPPGEVVRAFLPLARAAIDQVAHHGTRRGLTGPAARGDRETIAAHLDALRREDPLLEAVHRLLTRRAVEMAERAGRIDRRRARSLHRLLSQARRSD